MDLRGEYAGIDKREVPQREDEKERRGQGHLPVLLGPDHQPDDERQRQQAESEKDDPVHIGEGEKHVIAEREDHGPEVIAQSPQRRLCVLERIWQIIHLDVLDPEDEVLDEQKEQDDGGVGEMIRPGDPSAADLFVEEEQGKEEDEGFLGKDAEQKEERRPHQAERPALFQEELEEEEGGAPPEEKEEVSPADDPDDVPAVQRIEGEQKRGDLRQIGFVGMGLQEGRQGKKGEEEDQQVGQAQGDVPDAPELVLQEEGERQKGPGVGVLALATELFAEIAVLESRGQGLMLDEEEVVLEEDLIVPDEVVVKCLPVQAEYNDGQDGYIEEGLFLHGGMLRSWLFFFKTSDRPRNLTLPRQTDNIPASNVQRQAFPPKVPGPLSRRPVRRPHPHLDPVQAVFLCAHDPDHPAGYPGCDGPGEGQDLT